MTDVTCRICGSVVPAPGEFCSAGAALTCQGRPPEPGCGAVLTADERHWYGSSCENCERVWGERIDAWRRGGADAELDGMYSLPRTIN